MHTPGPWWYCYDNDTGPDDDYYDDFYSIFGADDKRIGQADGSEYDACLMSAAPELLESLIEVVKEAAGWLDDSTGHLPDEYDWYKKAMAAINKATGETK